MERTLAETRHLYWIPRGRLTIQGILNKCFICKRFKAKPLEPMMASLPSYRMQPFLPVFTHTGVDFFGPFQVSIFRRKIKRYGCIFTCFSTRAVHIEFAYSLDTDSFLSVLTRFESRRGTPAVYYSDNGTNLVGAVNELASCLSNLNQQKISRELTKRDVTWKFNPPASPHFGGVWESLVHSAKRALMVRTQRPIAH